MESALSASPIIYLFARDNDETRREYVGPMENEGFDVKLISPGVDDGKKLGPHDFDIATLFPLVQIDNDRERIAMFVHDFNAWEKKLLDSPPRNSAESIVRAVFVHRYKGIPFLNIENNSNALASKWGVETREILKELLTKKACLGEDELTESEIPIIQNETHPKITHYFRNKYLQAVKDLNIGLAACPFPSQFITDSNAPKENLQLLEHARKSDISEGLLKRAIAQAFPSGESVIVEHNLGGLSGALVFIARREGSAGMLIKFASWLEALREFEGAYFVIVPRLKTFVATLVPTGNGTGPVMFEEDGKRWGLITYSLVGHPAEKTRPSTLKSRIEKILYEPNRKKEEELLSGVKQTLMNVLGPVHGVLSKGTTEKRTIWSWLGDALPPLAGGELVTVTEESRHHFEIESYSSRGFKGDVASRLATAEWHSMWESVSKQQGTQQIVRLRGFTLAELKGKKGVRSVVVRHPDLGFRIECRVPDEMFLSEWPPRSMKYGFPVDLSVRFDMIGNPGDTPTPPASGDAVANVTPNVPKPPCYQATSDLKAEDLFEGDVWKLPLSMTFKAHASAVHGDLNLSNILFSEGVELGWLIDFDTCQPAGMVAFDFAKLEVELLSHFLIPRLIDLAARYPKLCKKNHTGTNDNVTHAWALLESILKTIDGLDVEDDFDAQWQLMLRNDGLMGDILGNTTLNPILFLLRLLVLFRNRAMQLLADAERRKEPRENRAPSELALAISVYAYCARKFAKKRKRADVEEMLLGVANWYLEQFWPGMKHDAISNSGFGVELEKRCNTPSQKARQEIVYMLRNMADKEIQPGEIGTYIAGPGVERINWEKPAWDFASTGCVANISPIIGYLWLMTRIGDHPGAASICVPKISSTGSGGGTVDTLEAGGYRFVTDIAQLQRAVKSYGGVFCKPSDDFSRIDKITMELRREHNLMKEPRLVFGSILAKKQFVNCRNTVIDIKVGRDSKLIPSNTKLLDQTRMLSGDPRIKKLLPGNSIKKSAEAILVAAGIDCSENGQYYSVNNTEKLCMDNLRLLITSADVPQCKAIGRNLILLMLHEEFEERVPFRSWPKDYKNYYLCLIPNSVDIEMDVFTKKSKAIKALKTEWKRLANKLPQLGVEVKTGNTSHFKLTHYFDNLKDKVCESAENPNKAIEITSDLSVATFAHVKAGTINFIDAYALDAWFEKLCDYKYDNEVGFWLHVLPGDAYKGGSALISVVYHPSRNTLAQIKQRMRQFLDESVEIIASHNKGSARCAS